MAILELAAAATAAAVGGIGGGAVRSSHATVHTSRFVLRYEGMETYNFAVYNIFLPTTPMWGGRPKHVLS